MNKIKEKNIMQHNTYLKKNSITLCENQLKHK
jgi:hypothetical protein